MNRQCQKLEQMFELARIARGWNRTQLAQALGRDPSRMVPPSGNPKLDVVVKLARVLEWPVGDVVEALYDGDSDDLDLIIGQQVDTTIEDRMAGLDGDGLYELALELSCTGRHNDCVVAARQMRTVGGRPSTIGEGWSFETVSWISLGRFVQAMESACAGLACNDLPNWLRQNLTCNLVESLYALQRLSLALGLCDSTLRELLYKFDANSKADMHHKTVLSVLKGKILRAVALQDTDGRNDALRGAEQELSQAIRLCDRYVGELPESALEARRLECEFALQSVHVESGGISAGSMCRDLLTRLDKCTDPAHVDSEELEAIGWCCVYGCDVAVRHLVGADRQQVVAVLSNKLIEIADFLEHWLLRERAMTLQYAIGVSGIDGIAAIDDADRANIVSTMGRFPQFRPIGWRLLEGADGGWV